MHNLSLKRTFDLTLSLILIVLFLPIILITSIIILVFLGRPIIFKQERPGYKGKIFTIYKFRTMSNNKDKSGEFLDDDKRLNKVGEIIRKLSLDELPQLWNVFLGDMSFVGPRPLLVEYLDIYTKEQARRHDVKPGITGWAQVNGRNAISWKEKFQYDIWYVDNQSFFLDMKILCKTFFKVFNSKDVNKQGHATTEKFNGNN